MLGVVPRPNLPCYRANFWIGRENFTKMFILIIMTLILIWLIYKAYTKPNVDENSIEVDNRKFIEEQLRIIQAASEGQITEERKEYLLWLTNLKAKEAEHKKLALKHDNENIARGHFYNIEKITHNEFEHLCANLLRCHGWHRVVVTRASGDQGIDVIAYYGDKKAVFQCKKYGSPVGNKAVQEIISGRLVERADIAAVVSNAAYTRSAKQLASKGGVYLLHHTDLWEFAERILKLSK